MSSILRIAVCALSLLVSGAQAAYPDKPVRLLMPFPAGGSPDLLGRTVATQVESQLNQTIVVDNRTGANGIIAYELTAKAPGDGYTIVHATPSFILNTIVYKKLPYDPLRDYAPISNIAQGFGYMVVVHPSVHAANLKELQALGKTTQLTYGTPGIGNTLQLATELLADRLGIKVLHVPYKGGAPALAALLGGEIQMMVIQPPAGVQQVKQGKLRAIAFTGAKRWSEMPDLPTVAESGAPGFVAHFTWNAWLAPAKTPRAIVARLEQEMKQAVAIPKVRDFLVRGGWEPLGSTAAELDAYMRAEQKRYAEAARIANLKPE